MFLSIVQNSKSKQKTSLGACGDMDQFSYYSGYSKLFFQFEGSDDVGIVFPKIKHKIRYHSIH